MEAAVPPLFPTAEWAEGSGQRAEESGAESKAPWRFGQAEHQRIYEIIMSDQQSQDGPAVASPPRATAPRARGRLAPQIGSLLASVRRRIHLYVWAEGIALAVAWLGAAFWITLLLDWWIEPPPLARQIMIGAVALGLLYLIYRFIVRRAFVRLADTNLAMLLERRFSEFGDSLLTTVEMADHPEHATDFNAQMLSHTQGEALGHLPRVRVADVFRGGPLVRAVGRDGGDRLGRAVRLFGPRGLRDVGPARSEILECPLAAAHAYPRQGLSRQANQDRQGLRCHRDRRSRHELRRSRYGRDSLSHRRRPKSREHEPDRRGRAGGQIPTVLLRVSRHSLVAVVRTSSAAT